MWQLVSLVVGAFAALGLVAAGFDTIQPLHGWPFARAILAVLIILGSAGVPTLLVQRLHPRLLPAHLLAYFATLLAIFVVFALLNMQVEL